MYKLCKKKKKKRCFNAKKKKKIRKGKPIGVEEGENITLYEHLDLHSNAYFSSFFVFWMMLLFRQGAAN